MELWLLFCPPFLTTCTWCDSSTDLRRICCGSELILWCTSRSESWTLLIYRYREIPWKFRNKPHMGILWFAPAPEGFWFTWVWWYLAWRCRAECNATTPCVLCKAGVFWGVSDGYRLLPCQQQTLGGLREGPCRGGACGVPCQAPFLWVILRENPWRQEGIGEKDGYGECLMCLLPARVLCIVLLGIFSVCNSLNLFPRLKNVSVKVTDWKQCRWKRNCLVFLSGFCVCINVYYTLTAALLIVEIWTFLFITRPHWHI